MADNQVRNQRVLPQENKVVVMNSVDHNHKQMDGPPVPVVEITGNDHGQYALQKKPSLDSPNPTLGTVPVPQKPKKGGFQITRVINKPLGHEDGDSVGEDLDETNTEDVSSDILDVSKTTDIEPDPSSEDTVQSLSLGPDDHQKDQSKSVQSLNPAVNATSTPHDVASLQLQNRQRSHSQSSNTASRPNIPQAFQPQQNVAAFTQQSVQQPQGVIPANVPLSQQAFQPQQGVQVPKDPQTFHPIQQPQQIPGAGLPLDNSARLSKDTPNVHVDKVAPNPPQPQRPTSANIDDTQFGLRFQIVRVPNERYSRGRWTCYDYNDSEKSQKHEREKSVDDLGSGNSSAASSVHFVPGIDDASKNPFAGATYNEGAATYTEGLHPLQSAASHIPNGDYARSSISVTSLEYVKGAGGFTVTDNQSSIGQANQALPSQLHQQGTMMLSQPVLSQSMASLQTRLGTAPNQHSHLANQQHAQSQSIPQSSMQNFSNIQPQVALGHNQVPQGGHDPKHHVQSQYLGQIARNGPPSQNHETMQGSEFASHERLSYIASQQDHVAHTSVLAMLDAETPGSSLLKASTSQTGLAPPLLEMVQNMGQTIQYMAPGDKPEDDGASTVAIDNKIEQAMDLVKSHLMFAVREEVEVLKVQIKELLEKNSQLEYENSVLRASATPETLAKLQAANPQQTATS